MLTDGEPWVSVVDAEGRAPRRVAGDALGAEDSRRLLSRDGSLARIELGVPARGLAGAGNAAANAPD